VKLGRVLVGRLGHSLEGVVQPDVALRTQVLEGEDHRQHRAAAPYAALGESAVDAASLAVADGVDHRQEAGHARDAVGERGIDDLPLEWWQLLEVGVVLDRIVGHGRSPVGARTATQGVEQASLHPPRAMLSAVPRA
jgi:hypothetical protein